jgi:hypothetical protein
METRSPAESYQRKLRRLQLTVDRAERYIESVDATWAESRATAQLALAEARRQLAEYTAGPCDDD